MTPLKIRASSPARKRLITTRTSDFQINPVKYIGHGFVQVPNVQPASEEHRPIEAPQDPEIYLHSIKSFSIVS
jgi:hypothetical protein